MDDNLGDQHHPAILKNDEELLDDLMAILASQTSGDPYSEDGSFAANLSTLPVGLRAMAATHWLDISLTLDSITWHFGNFGEQHLVAQTEAGLLELGLDELALCFREAKELMLPILAERTEADGDPDEIVQRKGLEAKADEINRRAWDLHDVGSGTSAIYAAWVKYARGHPAEILGDEVA